jgi:hypothetical protein
MLARSLPSRFFESNLETRSDLTIFSDTAAAFLSIADLGDYDGFVVVVVSWKRYAAREPFLCPTSALVRQI